MTSVVRAALGPAFEDLHPKVQWRFGLSSADSACQFGVGVMEEMTHSALVPPPVLWLGGRRGLFPAGKATDVPFTVANYAYVDDIGRETLSFVRRFSFVGKAQGMNSVMVTPARTSGRSAPASDVALDYLGYHSDMVVQTRCSVEPDGVLLLESGAPRVLGVRIPQIASALTTARGHAMLRILTIAGVEHPDTQARLQAGFNTPLRDTVTARLIAAGWTGEAARDASDAIVGGVVYAILSEGRSFQTGRAESIARTVLSGVSAR